MTDPARRCPAGYGEEAVLSYLCDGDDSDERRRFAEHLESTECPACRQELQAQRLLQESLNDWTPPPERHGQPLWATGAAEPQPAASPVPAAVSAPRFVQRHAWAFGFAAVLVLAAVVGVRDLFPGAPPLGETPPQPEAAASPTAPPAQQPPASSAESRAAGAPRSAPASRPFAPPAETTTVPPGTAPPAPDRVALVVGNSRYLHIDPLQNPENDARAISAALRRLGFQVTTRLNADRPDLDATLRAFSRRSAGATVSLVFYAGHGMEIDGINYLIPVDSHLDQDTDFWFDTVHFSDVLAATTGASLRMVILDACRENLDLRNVTGQVRYRSSSGGFADLNRAILPLDVVVAYAAQPTRTAADGPGRNSPYTTALLAHIERPLSIMDLFQHVRAEVMRSTNGVQQPREYPTLTPRAPRSLVAEAGTAAVDATALASEPEQLGLGQLIMFAEHGYLRAQDELGERYREGVDGLEQDHGEASRWFRRAAEQGDPYAQVNLGRMYSQGTGVPQDHGEALRWYRAAADQGHAHGQNNVGLAYMNGEGVERDHDEAFRWIQLAADQKNAHGLANLAVMYEHGYGVPRDYGEAAQWYRLAAERDYAGPTSVDDRAIAFAQVSLGYLYEDGLGVRQDYAAAARLYRRAAEHGSADAQLSLGYLYERGLGVQQNHAEAVKLYERAANQKDSRAYVSLGTMYRYGRGVRRDLVKAAEWYRRAADAGDSDAQYELASLYEGGAGGLTQDTEQATRWYRLAAGQGNSAAQSALDSLRGGRAATPGPIAAALDSPAGTATCSQDMGRVELGRQSHEGAWDGSCGSAYYTNGEFARYFLLELTRRTTLTIDLTSSVVDTWLALWTGTGAELLEEDDDDGDGIDARIVRVLDAGTYTIEATTLFGDQVGPFTLTVTAEPN